MRYIFLLLGAAALFTFNGCKPTVDTSPVNTPTNQDLRELEVTVHHVYQTKPTVEDSVMPGIEVRIYRSMDDLVNNTNVDGIQNTNVKGVADFKGRNDNYYYAKALSKKFGDAIDSVSTPKGTLSYLDLYFY